MVVGPQRSLSLAGLTGAHALTPGGAREQITHAAGLGYRAVQLDATAPGVRARDLDRSGWRDLAALLRRLGLGLSGLDLWVPSSHFADPAKTDRAVGAVTQAVELASELSSCVGAVRDGTRVGAVVCVTLPENLPAGVRAHVESGANLCGVRIADHAWPVRATGEGAIGVGFDPAAVILAGADPVGELTRLKAPPWSARLNDLSSAGRIEPGSREGKLDVPAYEAVLITKGYAGFLVVDLRGLADVARLAGALAKG